MKSAVLSSILPGSAILPPGTRTLDMVPAYVARSKDQKIEELRSMLDKKNVERRILIAGAITGVAIGFLLGVIVGVIGYWPSS